MKHYPPPLHIDLADAGLIREVTPFAKEAARNELIADAARAYREARRRNEDAEPCDWERMLVNVDYAWHRLCEEIDRA